MKMACIASMVVAGAAGFAASADTLYSQPLDISAGGIYSHGSAGAWYDELIGDNFTLSSAASVSGVRWWGGSEFFNSPDLDNMSGFRVEIYAAVGGLPSGAALYSADFAVNATNPTDVGVTLGGAIQYEHNVSFAPLNLAAGEYVVAIGAHLIDGFADNWVWSRTGLGYGDSITAQVPVGSAWSLFTGFGDMAFEIEGVIPAPGSLALLGLAGLAGRRRR